VAVHVAQFREIEGYGYFREQNPDSESRLFFTTRRTIDVETIDFSPPNRHRVYTSNLMRAILLCSPSDRVWRTITDLSLNINTLRRFTEAIEARQYSFWTRPFLDKRLCEVTAFYDSSQEVPGYRNNQQDDDGQVTAQVTQEFWPNDR
jgi:hypothetical protein